MSDSDIEKHNRKGSHSSPPVYANELSADDAALAACGYKQEFKREFTVWTSFAVSFSVLGLLPSVAVTLIYGMGYAGTAGMVWGWLLAMVGIQAVATSMAELASSMPTSGGLYYCSAVLAPPGWGPLASFLTGWSNWIGQVTGAPSVNYGNAAMILAAASVTNPNYVPQTWHTFLVTVLLMLVHACISSMPTRYVARFNGASTLVNISFLLIVIILIPSATTNTNPKFNSSREVWGTITNGTEWPNGIAILMSFVSIIWTMSGYDAPFHLAEECSNAQIATPRAIVMTAATGGILGWFLMLIIAYTVVDITGTLESPIGQPFVSYLQQVLNQPTVLAVTSMSIVCAFFMGQGCMVAALNAVWFNTFIGILLLLLMFVNEIAIGAIFSVGAIASYFAFTVPIAIRVFFVGNRFRPGPWNLGAWSRPIGIVACAYVLLMIPILCLPTVKGADLNASTMNWTVVVWAGPLLLAFIWFKVDAHKWFKGPIINLEHQIHGIQPVYTRDGDNQNGSNSETTFDKDVKGIDAKTSVRPAP
ncbi:hypothetical protein FRB96_008042 [Tulasnella sp. 330]|nr:hypothetical protein FRB96_008042 [Tulasnella sp. 330]KAG8882242.1 hypothetical protein FRB98_003846 [Tulasnella sp. 332]